jgi:DtxR family Mn-dependent transcriptional regulator
LSAGKSDIKSKITSNMEDYLEAIYELTQERQASEIRVTDIARRLRVTRPSVVGMIKHLVEHGLVDHAHYGGVELTQQGTDVAREMWHRHQVLRRFLEEVLGLDAVLAEEDACRMEHTLSPETIERFIALEEFREQGPSRGPLRGESFRKFLKKRRSEREKK